MGGQARVSQVLLALPRPCHGASDPSAACFATALPRLRLRSSSRSQPNALPPALVRAARNPEHHLLGLDANLPPALGRAQVEGLEGHGLWGGEALWQLHASCFEADLCDWCSGRARVLLGTTSGRRGSPVLLDAALLT